MKNEVEKYAVYISGRLKKVCDTPEEAWKVVEKRPFSAIYEVRDTKTGYVIKEFIPF